jgi:hypothetical protein
MNAARRGRRRSLLFTVTPVLAVVLIVIAIAAVVIHNKADANANAAPTAFGDTTTGSAPATTTTAPPTTTVPPTTTPDGDPALAARAVAEVDALHVSGVTYGAAILDRDTSHAALGDSGTAGFYSASVVKLFLITDILHRSEEGAIKLSSNDEYDIRRALELSDDNAMDNLWVRYHGPTAITELIKLADLHNTVLDTSDPGEWGETTISARDVVLVWQYALTKLSASDSRLVVRDTHSANNTGADGFDQAFGLLDPPRASTVKAKQGWMIAGSQMILNTTGVLGTDNQYVVAILTRQSAGIGYSQGRANVNRASALVQKVLAPVTK